MATRKRRPPPYDVFLTGELDDELVLAFQTALREAHNEVDATRPIRVNISCSGGGIELTHAIVSQIHEYRRQGRWVITHCSSGAYSGGATILQSGSHRTIDDFAYVMMHSAQVNLENWDGNAAQFEAYGLAVKKLSDKSIQMISHRSGLAADFIRTELFNGEDNYFDAPTALEYGLVDEILATP